MKIIQILPELNVGGVERGTVDFANYLVENGHESVVISNGGKLVKQLEASGSVHYSLPVHKKSIFSAYRMIKEVRRIIRREKADIVHARSRVPAWIAFWACRKTNASFITTCHGYYKSRLFSQVMGWAKLVIVPSQVIGRHMIEKYHVPGQNIRTIPRSVDLSRFERIVRKRNANAPFIISMVGRITALKGHRYFIQSIAQVIRSHPYINVRIIGDSPKGKESYRNELEVLVKRLGLEKHIEFLGNRDDIPDLLAQSDLLVLSTITQEAFGRVILEAQAMGTPVIATKVGGVVDIIDHDQNGLLVMPKDVDGMAKAITRMITHPELSVKFADAARQKIEEKFTLEHMASQTLSVYEELLTKTNILIIKLGSIGDVVLITASLKAIRKKFPKAQIHCLVGKDSRKVLQKCPHLNGVIVYDYKGEETGFWNLLKISRKLRRMRIDKIIDFQNNRKSHLVAFLSMARESYGFKNKKFGFLLSNPVKKYRNDLPPVAHQFQILNKLDMEYKPNLYLELWLSAKDHSFAAELLDSEWLGNAKKIVGLNVSASEKWPTKNWPSEYMAKLCDLLASRNIRVILTGAESDKGKAQHLESLTKSRIANFVGKTDIQQLASLIKRCKVFITQDSAPLHVAAAVNTPVICFFGPTSSARHIPPARKIHIFERKLSCSPCYSSQCRILTHACMQDIKPEEVLKSVESFLEGVE